MTPRALSVGGGGRYRGEAGLAGAAARGAERSRHGEGGSGGAGSDGGAGVGRNHHRLGAGREK